jgi:endonuclease IV
MFGPHIHKGTHKTYVAALARYIKDFPTMKVCQVFVMGPQNIKENFTEQEADEFGKFAKENNIKIIVHNSYLVSLWNNNQSRRPFARKCLQTQLLLCDIMNAAGFVIHIPNEEATDIAAELKEANITAFKTPIYLETKASRPTNSMNYEMPANLEKIFLAVKHLGIINHVGHCIDTAHLWSSGVSMTTHSEVTKYMSELSRIANGHLWGKLINDNPAIIFHLNDNINGFADGKDEHATLCQGNIWRHDNSGLEVLIDFIKRFNLMVIFERNKGENLAGDIEWASKLKKE